MGAPCYPRMTPVLRISAISVRYPATMARSELPELAELERIIEAGDGLLGVTTACVVEVAEHRFPVHVVTMGSERRDVPAVGFFGGIHGLERIGTEVVLAHLRNLVQRLRWDDGLARNLERLRMVFMPIVNPGGMWRGTRANPNGVDLMRNAPVESVEHVPFMISGQRLSTALPWFRGAAGAPMEAESQALCRVVREELLARPFSLALDCHSGFGVRDRIWFPHAHTQMPMAHVAEMHALRDIFEEAYAHHDYVFEPQSRQYLTHGDLWDYLYLEANTHGDRMFLPMTLEMGSWLWVKKNPRQLFSRHGIFNPLIEHRQQRVLRRHLAWMEFLGNAACSYLRWLPTAAEREHRRAQAVAEWYLERDR